MGKPLYQIFIEGIVVGQLLIWIFYLTKYIVIPNLVPLFDFRGNIVIAIFLSGFLFHLITEFTGINIWYVQNYYKILEKLKKPINKIK